MDQTTLGQLQWATSQRDAWSAWRDQLIQRAIEERYSERIIGGAAGMSGPAISYRKKRAKRDDV